MRSPSHTRPAAASPRDGCKPSSRRRQSRPRSASSCLEKQPSAVAQPPMAWVPESLRRAEQGTVVGEGKSIVASGTSQQTRALPFVGTRQIDYILYRALDS